MALGGRHRSGCLADIHHLLALGDLLGVLVDGHFLEDPVGNDFLLRFGHRRSADLANQNKRVDLQTTLVSW